MSKYELVNRYGEVIASNMSDETVFLFAKTYLKLDSEITIRTTSTEVHGKDEEKEKKKAVAKEYKDAASKYVQNVIKEETKKVVEEHKEEIKEESKKVDYDVMSLFE